MKLPAQWENLAEREKLIVMTGSAIFIVIILYVLLIQPFFTTLDDLQDQVESKRELISWLQPAAQKLQEFSNKGYHPTQPITGNLSDKINTTLQAHQLTHYVTQITSINDHQVKIVFHTVPFDAAMDWLTALWLSTGTQIKTATIIPLKTTGLASIELILFSN